MSEEISALAGSAVQIGAPITEKKVADVIVQARDRQLYHAITDCGAGGFSSAIGEMAAETGAYVELEKAPLKYQGLSPWEIWLSEAQERMVLAVSPRHLDELLSLCAIEEVEASILAPSPHPPPGRDLRRSDRCDLDMVFLHDGDQNEGGGGVGEMSSIGRRGGGGCGGRWGRLRRPAWGQWHRRNDQGPRHPVNHRGRRSVPTTPLSAPARTLSKCCVILDCLERIRGAA